MCFSPEISFAAGGIISIIGIFTLYKARAHKGLLFAFIPLLFASQQFVEGMLWLNLLENGSTQQRYWLTNIFNDYAFIVWPIVAPLSIFMLEEDKDRRNILKVIIVMGMATAFYAIKVLRSSGITPEIINHCIKYIYPAPQPIYAKYWYIAVTCLPFFLSTQTRIRWLGLVNIITFVVAYYTYNLAYISVWCFFAAVTSGLIYFYFRKVAKDSII